MGDVDDHLGAFRDCIQAALQHGVSLPCETLLHRDRREPSPTIAAAARIWPWRLDRHRPAPSKPSAGWSSPMSPRQPIKFHRFRLSGHSHRVEMFLSMLGLPTEIIDVDLRKSQHKTPGFLALNRFGQVPVIDDDGGGDRLQATGDWPRSAE